jgi:hypothetical protein
MPQGLYDVKGCRRNFYKITKMNFCNGRGMITCRPDRVPARGMTESPKALLPRKGCYYYTRAYEGAPSYSSGRACPLSPRQFWGTHAAGGAVRPGYLSPRQVPPQGPHHPAPPPGDGPTGVGAVGERGDCSCHAPLPLSCSCKKLTTHKAAYIVLF